MLIPLALAADPKKSKDKAKPLLAQPKLQGLGPATPTNNLVAPPGTTPEGILNTGTGKMTGPDGGRLVRHEVTLDDGMTLQFDADRRLSQSEIEDAVANISQTPGYKKQLAIKQKERAAAAKVPTSQLGPMDNEAVARHYQDRYEQMMGPNGFEISMGMSEKQFNDLPIEVQKSLNQQAIKAGVLRPNGQPVGTGFDFSLQGLGDSFGRIMGAIPNAVESLNVDLPALIQQGMGVSPQAQQDIANFGQKTKLTPAQIRKQKANAPDVRAVKGIASAGQYFIPGVGPVVGLAGAGQIGTGLATDPQGTVKGIAEGINPAKIFDPKVDPVEKALTAVNILATAWGAYHGAKAAKAGVEFGRTRWENVKAVREYLNVSIPQANQIVAWAEQAPRMPVTGSLPEAAPVQGTRGVSTRNLPTTPVKPELKPAPTLPAKTGRIADPGVIETPMPTVAPVAAKVPEPAKLVGGNRAVRGLLNEQTSGQSPTMQVASDALKRLSPSDPRLDPKSRFFNKELHDAVEAHVYNPEMDSQGASVGDMLHEWHKSQPRYGKDNLTDSEADFLADIRGGRTQKRVPLRKSSASGEWKAAGKPVNYVDIGQNTPEQIQHFIDWYNGGGDQNAAGHRASIPLDRYQNLQSTQSQLKGGIRERDELMQTSADRGGDSSGGNIYGDTWVPAKLLEKYRNDVRAAAKQPAEYATGGVGRADQKAIILSAKKNLKPQPEPAPFDAGYQSPDAAKPQFGKQRTPNEEAKQVRQASNQALAGGSKGPESVGGGNRTQEAGQSGIPAASGSGPKESQLVTPTKAPTPERKNWLDDALNASKFQRDNYAKLVSDAESKAAEIVKNATSRVSKKGQPVVEVEYDGQMYRGTTPEGVKAKIVAEMLRQTNPVSLIPIEETGFGAMKEILRRRGWEILKVEQSSKSESQYLSAYPPGRTPEEGPVVFRLAGHDNYSDPTLTTQPIEIGSGKVGRNGDFAKSTFKKLGNRADISNVAIHDLDEVATHFEKHPTQPNEVKAEAIPVEMSPNISTKPEAPKFTTGGNGVTAESVGVKSSIPKGTPNEKTNLKQNESVREVQQGQGTVQGEQPQRQGNGQKANAVVPEKEEVKYAASNAASNDIRARLGIDALPEANKRSWDTVFSKATGSYDADKIDARVKDTKQPLNDVETAQVALRSAELEKKLKTATGDQYDELEKKLREHTVAAKNAGTEQGRALAARNLAVLEDYSLAGMYRRYAGAAKVKSAEDFSPDVRAKIKELADSHEKLTQQIAGLQSKFDEQAARLAESERKRIAAEVAAKGERKASSRATREDLVARIKKKQAQYVSSVPVQGLIDAADDIKALVRLSIQDGKTDLDEIYRDISAQLKPAGVDLTRGEFDGVMAGAYRQTPGIRKDLTQYQQLIKEARESRAGKDALIYQRIRALDERIKNYQYDNLKTTGIGKALTDAEIALKAKQVEFDRLRTQAKVKAEYDAMSPAGKVAHSTVEIFNAIRSVVASTDISAPLNQGLFYTLSHPGKSASAVWETMGALKGDEALNHIMGKVRNNRYYDLAKGSKLQVGAAAGDYADDFFAFGNSKAASVLTGKYSPIGASERIYKAYVTKIRMDMFADLAKAEERHAGGRLKKSDYEAIAEFVNTVTGTTTNRYVQAVAKPAGAISFAPKYTVARIKTAFATPAINAVRVGNYHLAGQILGEYAKVAAAIGTGVYIANKNGANVEMDPRKPGFMKGQIGNVSFDAANGLGQTYKLVAAILNPGLKQITGIPPVKGKEAPARGALESYFMGKLAPGPRTLLNVINKQSYGKSYDVKTQEGWKNLGLSLLPISVQDGANLAARKDISDEQKAVIGLAGFLGVKVDSSPPYVK